MKSRLDKFIVGKRLYKARVGKQQNCFLSVAQQTYQLKGKSQ